MIVTGDDEPARDADEDDDEWPPFKKVGAFDPLLDDNRLVILKLALCPVTQLLIVGGAAGQVFFYNLAKDDADLQVCENLHNYVCIICMVTLRRESWCERMNGI